ncbi:hypothetical protein JXC34_03255 [Candidatus Woesearchaeota archaeon]|nr:hypothetical protein [Candidatus Woesearchaeota archaeon]
MIHKFRITCGFCGKIFEVRYGLEGKEVCYDIFSCPKCRNLFSLSNNDVQECPQCNNRKLNHYNPHKKENLEYYDSMKKQGVLVDKNFEKLKEYWKYINDTLCPCCGHKSLKWEMQDE